MNWSGMCLVGHTDHDQLREPVAHGSRRNLGIPGRDRRWWRWAPDHLLASTAARKSNQEGGRAQTAPHPSYPCS
jgi:hypothetical protein